MPAHPLVLAAALVALAALGVSQAAHAQGHGSSDDLLEAQREAMRPLERMDGAWRGSAWTLTPDGTRHELTQTERVGTFLDGTVRMIEGRGYEADGTLGFNALGVVSYDPATAAYRIRTWAMGRGGDFAFRPTDTGFEWEIPAGPALIRYTATLTDSTWVEVGDRHVEGQPPMRFFEMTLERLGDTDWPAAGAVPMAE